MITRAPSFPSAASSRPQDAASAVVVAAALGACAFTLAGHWRLALAGAGLAAAGGAAALRWSRTHPGPMPYAFRWVLRLPRGPHAPRHVVEFLAPRPGERILEIGPGIGVHALPVANALAPGGRLQVLDAQQAMLDALSARAEQAGIENIDLRLGDACTLPFADASFDAAYLNGVLGELPDAPRALRELRRVLTPEGRLMIGETMLDPDYVPERKLLQLTRDAGFVVERKQGSWWASLTRFRAMGTAIA
ncbi:methyltransferase domain-containing protein [Pendulispora rubella]|uniref:Methyltransferase domain-containing protein n=1 Tax=Pendulispora rubella TaxID=2741070 RepID=A0ABZ2LER1_9BACT